MRSTKLTTLMISLVAVCSMVVLTANAGDMKTGSSDSMMKPMASQGQGGMENKMHGTADMSNMEKEDMKKDAVAMDSEKSMKGSMDKGVDKPMKKVME